MMMRAPMIAMLIFSVVSSNQSARAKRFDPRYPVCLQIYGPDSGVRCNYASMSECRLAAAARPAQCVLNPYRRVRPTHGR
jgi:Protein of unknown function (DUF3551)